MTVWVAVPRSSIRTAAALRTVTMRGGRLITIDDGSRRRRLAFYTYDPLGRIANLNRDNEVVSSYQYDMAGQLTDIEHVNGSQALASTHYELDLLGRRVAQTREDNISGGASRDAVHAEFSYDARNRCLLRRYYTRGSQGRWEINQTDSRVLAYDRSWNLLSERTLNGREVGSYAHGLHTDEILQWIRGDGTAQLPLVDGLGSTVALTGKQGRVTERYRTTVYGTPRALSASYQPQPVAKTSGYRFVFTGREWLDAVSLNDHRNRYYCPSLGQWTTTDPISFLGGLNLYAYVRNSPTSFSDSYGLATGTFSLANYYAEAIDSEPQVYKNVTYTDGCENRQRVCYVHTVYAKAETQEQIWSMVTVTIDTGSDGPSASDWMAAAGGVASVIPGASEIAGAIRSTGAIVNIINKTVNDRTITGSATYQYSYSTYVKSRAFESYGHVDETLSGSCPPVQLPSGWQLVPGGAIYFPNGP